MMSDLNACPFCGRIPDLEDCGAHQWFIRCKCGIAQDKLYAQKCDAVRAWNKRKVPITDTISRQAAIDALKTAELGCEVDVIMELPSAEPEPCEDSVSREAVSEWLKQYGQDVLHGKYKFSLMYIWKNLMALPSAEPVRMKGRWETDSYGAMDDGEYLVTRCSVCGTAYEYGHDDRYCGFCGAEMSEGDE